MSLETELRQTLSAHLFDVTNLSGKDVVKLAEAMCSLEYNPEFYFKQSLAIVEGTGSVTPEELKQAAKLIDIGCAEQEADIAQAEIGQALGRIYRDGDADLGIAPDLRKAGKYGRSPDALPASKKGTEFAYKGFLWFTRVRLFLVRADRIFKDFKHPILAFPWLSKGAALGGLSYFGEFLVDCGILFKAAFFPTKEQRAKTPGLWNRVKNTFYKGDRIYRMANVRWGIGNLLSFLGCFIPPITAAMNLVLFASDLLEDHIKYKRDQKNPQSSLAIIAAEKVKLKKEILHLENHEKTLQKLMQAAILEFREYKHTEARIIEVQKQLHVKRNRLAVQTSIETKLVNQREADLQKRRRIRYVTGAILLGMAILLVPQIFAPAAILSVLAVKVLAATIAMSGSVAGGLVRGVYDEYKSSKYRKPVIEIKVSDTPQVRLCKVPDMNSPDLACEPPKITQSDAIAPSSLSAAARQGIQTNLFYKKKFSSSAPVITKKLLEKPKQIQRSASQPIPIKNSTAQQRPSNFYVGSTSAWECLPRNASAHANANANANANEHLMADEAGFSFVNSPSAFFQPASSSVLSSSPAPSLPPRSLPFSVVG